MGWGLRLPPFFYIKVLIVHTPRGKESYRLPTPASSSARTSRSRTIVCVQSSIPCCVSASRRAIECFNRSAKEASYGFSSFRSVMNWAFMVLLYSDCDGLSSPLRDFPSEGNHSPLYGTQRRIIKFALLTRFFDFGTMTRPT